MGEVYIHDPELRRNALGLELRRPAASLPQSAHSPLFAISTGRVLLMSLVGEVTTIIQNQANNTKLTSYPTTGSAVDLCAVLNIANKEVGTLFGITGLFSDALKGANAGAVETLQRPVVLPVGTLDLDCAASNTGGIKWLLTYVPLDDGARVAVA
jgi:hypothetical protein